MLEALSSRLQSRQSIIGRVRDVYVWHPVALESGNGALRSFSLSDDEAAPLQRRRIGLSRIEAGGADNGPAPLSHFTLASFFI